MNVQDALKPKSILLDAALIGGLLVGLNALFDRSQLGWTNFNPSPYLLLPLLIGGRYGFTAGLLSGVGTSLVVLALQSFGGAGSPSAALAQAPYLHASFLFLGGIAGELYGWFRRERAQAAAQLEKLQTSVRRLDADVSYLRGVKDELDRAVAARDGEVSTLDAELRRLYAASREDLPSATLAFLRRQVRLTDAALYAIPSGEGALTRLALIGRDNHLPESLGRKASAVVRLAIERSSLVTLPELLQQREPSCEDPILLAAPLRDAAGKTLAVLVVSGMPFISFTAQTGNLISLICGWAGEVLDLASGAGPGRYRIVAGRDLQRIFTREHFRHLLQLAFEANKGHRLPSSIVVFSLPGVSPREQARFEGVIASAIRAGDYAAELGHSHPHLAVLLPLVGERGASIFIERCRQFVRQSGPWPSELDVRRVEIGRVTDVEAILAELDGASSKA